MAAIEEIPITAEGAQGNVQDIPEGNPEIAQEISENTPAPLLLAQPPRGADLKAVWPN